MLSADEIVGHMWRVLGPLYSLGTALHGLGGNGAAVPEDTADLTVREGRPK